MTTALNLKALATRLGPEFAKVAAQHDSDGTFVADNYRTLKEHKIFSAMIPKELGGGGYSHGEVCEFLRIIGRHCGSTALAVSMHQHLVAAAVFNYRNGRPGQAMLEKVVAGELVLISTGANDWLDSSGEAIKVEGGFRVSAKKPFASGSPAGDVFSTSFPYNDPEEGWQVLHCAVPRKADGVSSGDDWDTFGMRATGSDTAIFENVFVPDEAVALRRPREGYHPVFDVVVGVAMPLIMSAYLGVAEAAADIAIEQAKKRSEDPSMPFHLGELVNTLTTAQIAVDSMVAMTNDFDVTFTAETSSAMLARKTIAANAVLAAAEKALQTVGGGGFFRKLGLERCLRDLHGAQFHPLPEKRQQHFTGQLILGKALIVEGTAKRMRFAA